VIDVQQLRCVDSNNNKRTFVIIAISAISYMNTRTNNIAYGNIVLGHHVARLSTVICSSIVLDCCSTLGCFHRV